MASNTQVRPTAVLAPPLPGRMSRSAVLGCCARACAVGQRTVGWGQCKDMHVLPQVDQLRRAGVLGAWFSAPLAARAHLVAAGRTPETGIPSSSGVVFLLSDRA